MKFNSTKKKKRKRKREKMKLKLISLLFNILNFTLNIIHNEYGSRELIASMGNVANVKHHRYVRE
jgi:hypothetical protein